MAHNIKDNLDIIDEYQMQHVWGYEGVVYSGDTKSINIPLHDEKSNVSPMMSTAILGPNNTGTPDSSISKYDNIWTDIDAQEIYCNKKPTCYVIFGKPGLGAYSLGEAISKKYNCIHLCPRNIINDELMQGSLTGKCLDFNMKHNNICAYDTILKLLDQKLKSPAVEYRGYVISGIPLVYSSEKPLYLIKSKHSEDAFENADEVLFDLIYNLKRKKPKGQVDPTQIHHMTEGEKMEELGVEEEEEEEAAEEQEENEEEEEEEGVAELPKFITNPCSKVFFHVKAYYETKHALLVRQLQTIFNLQPDVIIYITCPDADVITKKKNKYINYKTGLNTVKPFAPKLDSDLRWPTRCSSKEYENPHDLHIFNPKYNCRPPINFHRKSVNQICNYRKYILPLIEQKIMDYDPRYVIKVDGRTSIYQMMHQISDRLILLDVTPVIIPEPLYLQEVPEELSEFWDMVNELKVIRSGVVSFNRCASAWFNRCPVELKKRRSMVGKPKYSVMMFKHVYLLSSLDNFTSFCMNPRPFLKMQYLEPTCRIVVMGTKSSGKSMVAKCLSWLFDTPIISYTAILDIERKKKYLVYSRTILSEISATIEDARFREWEMKERSRINKLKEWSDALLVDLKKYIPLLSKHLEHVKAMNNKREAWYKEKREEIRIAKLARKVTKKKYKQQVEEAEENEEEEEEEEIEEFVEDKQDPKFVANFMSYRNKLYFLPIDDLDECNTMLANKMVSKYADAELIEMTEKPSLPPVLGDDDVTKGISDYIVANDLKNEIEPTTEEIMLEIIEKISSIDQHNYEETKSEQFYGTYIIDDFPSNPESMEILSGAKLTPDYTIGLIENREIVPSLMQYYANMDKYKKNPYVKLSLVKDPLVLCKLQTRSIRQFEVPDSDNADILTDEPDPNTELIAAFTESIEKFREEWDAVKVHLEDKNKCYIEIELENKTDVEVLEHVFLKLRHCYYLSSTLNEDGDEPADEDNETPKDLLTYNNPNKLSEIGMNCPVSYFKYGVLWEGKPEFSVKYDNRTYYFAKEEFLEEFQKDETKYQAYNRPFKTLPKLKICIIGCLGSGKTMLAKRIAQEVGLMHIDFEDIINYYLLPRHFKKVGRKYENPFLDTPLDEEGVVVEFQQDEENANTLADIFSNENELRRIVYNYFERGQPIMPLIMHKIIKKLWHTYPYTTTGFVIEGYPRLTQDMEDLLACNCIPDLVIELENTVECAVDRLGPIMHKQWQTQLKEAKELHKQNLEVEKKTWMRFIIKTVVVKLIVEEIIDRAVFDPLLSKQEVSIVESFIFDANPLGSATVDPKLFSFYNETIEAFPEPKDTREWDKSDEIRENIDSRIEALYENDYENIESIKEILTENQINVFSINGEKPFYKVIRIAFAKFKHLRNRNQSFFEETIIITTDIAEILLEQGFCFISKFGRLCPVYIHENPRTIIDSYKISRRKDKIFPVVHRTYIYFICSEDNVIKFRTDPLKYITSGAIQKFKPFPLSIGIIGAPKSGKSVLATKLAKTYNLICISRGTALRHILDNMYWTDLGSKILKNLESGETVLPDYIISAVQTIAIDHRTNTCGFVLDGFPATPYEAKLLIKYGLYPNMMFDINTDKPVLLENSQKEIYHNILKYKPPFSYSLIDHRYPLWQQQAFKIRTWINSDYQNIFVLNGNVSKWKCLQEAYNYIKDRILKINNYLVHYETSIVPAYAMNISNEVFRKKESSFKIMCPVCLRQNILRHNCYPNVDKTGVVYFNNRFYWVCNIHMDLVLKNPVYYLLNLVDIPELPAVVHVVNSNNVYANGICIVTYAENLPGQVLDRGTNKYAAAYKDHTYLFCSEVCLRKFLDKPHIFSDITVFKGAEWFPRLSLKNLPDLGYLEQTLANILTEACCSVNAIRPKYPGLSIQLSAVLYIALFVKTHNPNLPQTKRAIYIKALKLFENRSKLVLDLGLRMRSMENPFSIYPNCNHRSPKYYSPIVSVKGEMSPEGASSPITALAPKINASGDN